ncbi:MAG: phosphoglucosamine mutase [Candidatus Rokubacteria bacterium]|nr:phosphoglucosamine mutase [Candidatus Rokubacteria bacterium]
MTKLFGTDGIRGIANEDPLTPDLAYRLGRELVATLMSRGRDPQVRLVIGRDTRLSGPMLEAALTAGALSAGAECVAAGVLPTPGIAILTRELRAHGGVVLSASHNPFEDNGIKLFSGEGSKFPDAWEAEIETRLGGPDSAPRPSGAGIGCLVPYARAEADYIRFLRAAFGLDLRGFALVLDCAHGATYRVAPRLFRGLGARVITLGTRPDGTNINRGCGALFPQALQTKVKATGAHVGFAFDGDGDRLIAVDETGKVRDGDYLLAICARHLKGKGELKGNQVVTTVMANLGLDRSLAEARIGVVKTQVGDRYVLEEMERRGAYLGGEQSGHLIFLDRAPTGDGLLSALQLLAVMRERDEGLSALARCLTKVPQVLVNVPVREKPPIESIPGLAARTRELESAMNGAGRILVRYSGTEPLARVMIEGEDRLGIQAMAQELAALIARAIGADPA